LFVFFIQGSTFGVSSPEEKILIDKTVLLIVKKVQRSDDLSDDVVEVLRMTDDVDLIKQFQVNGNNFTPLKVSIAYLFNFSLTVMKYLDEWFSV
jgi:hypothetical protein